MEKEEKTQRSVGQAHRTPKVPLTLTGMEKRSQLRFGGAAFIATLLIHSPQEEISHAGKCRHRR